MGSSTTSRSATSCSCRSRAIKTVAADLESKPHPSSSAKSAYINGIQPRASLATRDAPSSSASTRTHSTSPHAAAWCKGVAPLASAARTEPGCARASKRSDAVAPEPAA